MGIRFRVWDREKMFYPKLDDEYDVTMSGVVFLAGDEIEKKDAIAMLSTGLKDKDGKEIWEGDVASLTHKDGEVVQCHIFWCGNMPGFGIRELDGWDPMTRTGGWRPDAEYQVIGNIHENPELLKTAEVAKS